jgi:PKD repeat protein
MRKAGVPVGLLGVVLCLLLVLPACGGGSSGGSSSSPAAPSTPNQAPTGSFTISPSNIALMAATVLTFVASGRDPEGGALTYTWSFGDGTAGSGASVQHTFNTAGVFTVTVTIGDPAGATGTSSQSVTVKSLTGQWSDEDPRWTIELLQNSSAFTGDVVFGPIGHVSEIESGVVSNPRSVRFFRRATHWWSYEDTYVGELDATLDHLNAAPLNESCCTFTLTRR